MQIDPDAVMHKLGLSVAASGGNREHALRLMPQFGQKPAYSVDELLAYSGSDFIDVAYQAVLRRQPDEAGRRDYLQAIETGALTKTEVLGELRKSPEGYRAGVPIRGLRLQYLLRRMERRRGGRMLALLASLMRLARKQSSWEAMEARLASRDERMLSAASLALDGMREDVARRLDSSLHALRKSIGRGEVRAARSMADVSSRQDATEQRLASVESSWASVEVRLSRSEQHAARWMEEMAARFERNEALLESCQAAIREESQRRAGYRAYADAVGQHPPVAGASEEDMAMMYARLEEVFRGSEEEIRRRAEIYLPCIAEAAAATRCRRVLDLGCGRGELLALLGGAGYDARGVDLNRLFVEQNRAAGREVVLMDALTALEGCEPDSLAAVSAIHLAEHLSVNHLVRLLDLAFAALRPGGVLILETPNPQNLRTSAYYFYFDPTHRNPLPPPLLAWMVADRGFREARIDLLEDGRFSPETTRVPPDAVAADQVNRFVDWVSVSPDYAVVATKPIQPAAGTESDKP
ncbi:MAG: hypothetical protein DI635_13955 [Pseudoxanthomonas suwonensis]|nr:MAG: hypothetical protein DI635_13955 [Pseudoxanthomonas suwonensis]